MSVPRCCRHAIAAYKGPLIVIAIGAGFMVIGTIPVVVTFCMEARSSATIIGVGFMGFGLLVVLPGVGWGLVRRASTLRACCSRRERLRSVDSGDKASRQSSIRSSGIHFLTRPDSCRVHIVPNNILGQDDGPQSMAIHPGPQLGNIARLDYVEIARHDFDDIDIANDTCHDVDDDRCHVPLTR